MLYDPHRKWGPYGICREEDAQYFFAPGGLPDRKPTEKTQAAWDQAKEICQMCPVLAQCRRDTLGEEYGVYGGLDQYQRFQVRMALRKAVRRWPQERRRAWGRELQTLREMGLKWSGIHSRTGLPQSAAEWLLKEWLAEQPAPQPTATVVDLPLPPLREETPFPPENGRRDAWVRHRGVVSDGWYRGETADGQWINVTTHAGRGQVHKWFHKDDVRLYRPQAVVVLNYTARPDDRDHDLTA
jgi:hypothetical protein